MNGMKRAELKEEIDLYKETTYCVYSEDTGMLLEEWNIKRYPNGEYVGTQLAYEYEYETGMRVPMREYSKTVSGTFDEICDAISQSEMYV